jgi:hypothetical protein
LGSKQGAFTVLEFWKQYQRHAMAPTSTAYEKGYLSGDLVAIVIGGAVYALMLKWGHQLIAGVPLLH